ncbi:MAG: hypothetical protein KGH58_00970 [Candidatus Micrarchaeota archaeon]|nr:hypothetical protein [Candidatus Micrarchaeota archaeon]
MGKKSAEKKSGLSRANVADGKVTPHFVRGFNAVEEIKQSLRKGYVFIDDNATDLLLQYPGMTIAVKEDTVLAFNKDRDRVNAYVKTLYADNRVAMMSTIVGGVEVLCRDAKVKRAQLEREDKAIAPRLAPLDKPKK